MLKPGRLNWVRLLKAEIAREIPVRWHSNLREGIFGCPWRCPVPCDLPSAWRPSQPGPAPPGPQPAPRSAKHAWGGAFIISPSDHHDSPSSAESLVTTQRPTRRLRSWAIMHYMRAERWATSSDGNKYAAAMNSQLISQYAQSTMFLKPRTLWNLVVLR